MKIVSRVLSSGMQGDDVRELHDELERLDIFIPPGERNNALFGSATKKAVMNLQRARFSENRVTGIVDQATANLLGSETRYKK
jgi:peptidoglycan hydrolase-like protein with peptidoglycan-binding domain